MQYLNNLLIATQGGLTVVVSTAHRLDPARATPFADVALELRSYGLAVIPLGDEKEQTPGGGKLRDVKLSHPENAVRDYFGTLAPIRA